MFSMVNFHNWLQNKLDEREWTQADLSRKTKASRATISNIISGKRGVGMDMALAISKAFDVPVLEVLEVAGLVGSQPVKDRLIETIVYLTSQLPESEREGIVEYVKLRLRMLRK